MFLILLVIGCNQCFARTFVWTGGISTLWNNPSNWNITVTTGSTSTYPGQAATNDDVSIGATAYGANQPNLNVVTTIASLTFGSATAPTLTLGQALTVSGAVVINASSIVNISGTAAFNISGNFTNNTGATFTATGTSTIYFNGSTQTITNNSVSGTTPTVAFGNLNLTNFTKTFAGSGYYSINAASILTVGNFTTVSIPSTSTHLVFLTGTTAPFLTYAQIATIPSTSSIQGAIDYQVYFTGGVGYRNYRSMGAPVYDTPTSYTASNGTYDLKKLKNTFIITGNGGATNGFDASTNNGATIRKYNSSTNNYTFVTNLTTEPPIATGKGFYMYYRGDRTIPSGTATTADPFGSKTSNAVAAYATPETNVIHTYTGIPNQGDVSTSFGAVDSKYYFIDNPYPATLSFDAIYNSSYYYVVLAAGYYISPYSWIWDPKNSTYALYDFNNPTASANKGKPYIVPGQGFFIQAATSTGALWASPTTLTITESMKSTANNANGVRFSTSAPTTASTEAPIIRLQLYKNEFYNDEIGIVLRENVKDSLDKLDGLHREWTNAILTTITPDNQYLSIDKRPIANRKTTIPLYINTVSDSVYTFKKTYGSPLMQNYKVTLYDNLLKDSIDIAHNDYAFRIDLKRPETFGGKRFTVTIEQLPSQPSLLTFEGKLNTEKKGVLDWKTSSYKPGATYQLQRSQDNQSFINIGNSPVAADSIAKNSYEFIDNGIKTGNNYYRLIETDMFNKQTISATVTLANTLNILNKNMSKGFTLYPNPIVSDSFSILSDKNYSGKITLTVYSSNSEVKHTETLSQISSSAPIHESISGLRHGVYFIEIRVDNKVVNTLKFIKQ